MSDILSNQNISRLLKAETDVFFRRHPKSNSIYHESQKSLINGVPMQWMSRLPGPFPIYFEKAQKQTIIDVDQNTYVDFCLGDTGSMTGHGSEGLAKIVSDQIKKGISTMMPQQDSQIVAELLTERFGLPYWQLAMTATDANRFVLRYARHLTKRPKILVFDYCYHGTVDETLAVLDDNNKIISRPGAIGPQVDVNVTTKVIPFNDIPALEAALKEGDVAAVLAEPAMTNIGIILPEPGYLDALRKLTKQYGTWMIIDETHTICVGPGGATKAWNLKPDALVIGKPIGSGIPVAAYGFARDIAVLIGDKNKSDDIDVSGIGGTLTGNALQIAAVKYTLQHLLLDKEYQYTISLANSWTKGVQSVINKYKLDWCVIQLGCRAEYWFTTPPQNGKQANNAQNHLLETYLHLFCINRGVFLTPFHNMALFSPYHTQSDVDKHTEVFDQAIQSLFSSKDAKL